MGNEVYRPKRRRGRRLRRLLVALLLAAVVAAIASFFICQKYLVYTDDGVRLDPKAAKAASSGAGTQRPAASPLVVDVEVEIGKAITPPSSPTRAAILRRSTPAISRPTRSRRRI